MNLHITPSQPTPTAKHRQQHTLCPSTGPLIFLVAVVLLCYGFELFNLHLSMDEELHAAGGIGASEWISQGRWAMAALNYAVLPRPVAPVTSTFVGVVGTLVGLFLIISRVWQQEARSTAVVAALAISVPTFAFIFSFGTIAYGIGIGFVLLAAGVHLVASQRVWMTALACVLGAVLIGIYQPFIFCIALVAAAAMARELRQSTVHLVRRCAHWLGYAIGSVPIYFAINTLVTRDRPARSNYIGDFVDLRGLAAEPTARLNASFQQLLKVLGLDPSYFGSTSVWLQAAIVVAVVCALAIPLYRKDWRVLGANALTLVAVSAIVVVGNAVSHDVPPLRTMLHVPVAIAVIVAVGIFEVGWSLRLGFMIVCGLAIIGNSAVNNHLFASTASAEFQDRLIAQGIVEFVESTDPDAISTGTQFTVELVGMHKWPQTPLRSRRETFGASFFEWDDGNSHRVAAYLRLNGLNAVPAIGATLRTLAYDAQLNMPIYPQSGWIRLVGRTVVLKFGNYTPGQANDLCRLGVLAMCPQGSRH